MTNSLIKVEDIHKIFYKRRGWFGDWEPITALAGISFEIKEGECFGIVGESGSGKTTLARIMLGLTEPTRGSISYHLDGRWVDVSFLAKQTQKSPLTPFGKGGLGRIFRRRVQMIFQEADAALDPKYPICSSVEEAYKIHYPQIGWRQRRQLAQSVLRELGLTEEQFFNLPKMVSGGERKRVLIARAFAALGYLGEEHNIPIAPRLLVADEPTSGMDAITRAHILNIFAKYKRKLNLTYLLISHDLKTVEFLCDRLAIMYAGKIVEMGERDKIFHHPQHSFTRELLDSELSLNEISTP